MKEKEIEQCIEEIIEDFRDRFQQANDEPGYFGWESETQFIDVEHWLRNTLTTVLSQIK